MKQETIIKSLFNWFADCEVLNSDNNLNVDYLDGEPENYCLEVVPCNPIVKEPLIKSRINAVCTSCSHIFRRLAQKI